MVLAISTVLEGSGQSEIGYRLFESVREAADRILHSESIEIRNLPFLALVVSSYFPQNNKRYQAMYWEVQSLHDEATLFKLPYIVL